MPQRWRGPLPRNGSGVYTLAEPPFVSGTVISSADMNSDLSDIADALTGSVASDGQTLMTGPLGAFAGTLALPGMSWAVDPDTGRYRPSANAMTDVCGGAAVAEYTTTGVNFPLAVKQFGLALIPIGLGPLPWSRTAAPAGWVFDGATYSRTTYSALWVVAEAEIALNNDLYGPGDGSTTFTIASCAGRALVGVDSSGTVLPGVTGMGDATGDATKTIAQANLPSANLDVDIPGGQGEHDHPSAGGPNPPSYRAASTGGVFNVFGGGAYSPETGPATLPALTGTAALGGSGTALSVVQPVRAVKFIIYAGA